MRALDFFAIIDHDPDIERVGQNSPQATWMERRPALGNQPL